MSSPGSAPISTEAAFPGTIRRAVAADLSVILDIEKQSFPTCWKPDTYQREMSESRSIFLTSLDGEDVTGYALSWVVADEVHLLKVAVAPEQRRQGIGRALVLKTIRIARDAGCKLAYLEVRTGNRAALRMYARLDFVPLGVRRGYYTDTGEDALVLAARFDVSEDSTATGP